MASLDNLQHSEPFVGCLAKMLGLKQTINTAALNSLFSAERQSYMAFCMKEKKALVDEQLPLFKAAQFCKQAYSNSQSLMHTIVKAIILESLKPKDGVTPIIFKSTDTVSDFEHSK